MRKRKTLRQQAHDGAVKFASEYQAAWNVNPNSEKVTKAYEGFFEGWLAGYRAAKRKP